MSEWQWQIVDIAIVLFESVFLYYWYFSEKFEFRLYGIKRCLLMSLFPITTFILDIAVKNVPINEVDYIIRRRNFFGYM